MTAIPATVRPPRRWIRRATLMALLMLAPNFLGFLVFTAGPVIFSLIMAFTNWDLTIHNEFSRQKIRFVGVENFQNLLAGPEQRYFIQFLSNTGFMMLAIPVGVALALVSALLLSSEIAPARGRRGLRNIILAVALTTIACVFCVAIGASPLSTFFYGLAGFVVVLGMLFGRTSFRSLYYLPSLTSGVATFILWKALYRPETGPINRMVQPVLDGLAAAVRSTPAALWSVLGWVIIVAAAALLAYIARAMIERCVDRDISILGAGLSMLGAAAFAVAIAGLGWIMRQLPADVAAQGGLDAPAWLNSMTWSKPAIMLMGVFMAMGSNNMLLYLAALSNVPRELYEAADIDGASRWQMFWSVTWPQLAPTTFFIVVMSIIGGLQGGFETARVMTEGGPAGSTTTLSYYLYMRAFMDYNLGFASSIAWTMFAMIFVITLVNWRFGNKMVND